MSRNVDVFTPGRSRWRTEVSRPHSHEIIHLPVLLEESMAFLAPSRGGCYLDGTAGGGGHAQAILERSSPDGSLVLIDRDEEALRRARTRLAPYASRITLHHGNYADLPELTGPDCFFDGVILDLGLSSLQLESDRGFSFMRDEPLDMRMDRRSGRAACDLVNTLSRDELAEILWTYGEERRSRKIADAIVRFRDIREIRTTGELASAVRKAADPRYRVKSLARVFQAIRIRVNDELGSLERGLPVLLSRLAAGGTLVVISYHSLEDRIVKRFFREAADGCACPHGARNPWCTDAAEGVRLTKRVVKPTDEERRANRRSRSARLRAFRRSEGGRAS